MVIHLTSSSGYIRTRPALTYTYAHTEGVMEMTGTQHNTPDPTVVVRARDLLSKADSLAAHAGDAPDDAERLRELYVCALRAAGAALVIGESPTAARRGSSSAWARLPRAIPSLTTWATYFAGLSRLRADIEVGIVRDVDPEQVSRTHARLLDFLDDVEAEVVAYEQGRPRSRTTPVSARSA